MIIIKVKTMVKCINCGKEMIVKKTDFVVKYCKNCYNREINKMWEGAGF